MNESVLGFVVLVVLAIACGVVAVRVPSVRKAAAGGVAAAALGLLALLLALVGKEEKQRAQRVNERTKAFKDGRKDGEADSAETEEKLHEAQAEEKEVHEEAKEEQQALKDKKKKRTRVKG